MSQKILQLNHDKAEDSENQLASKLNTLTPSQEARNDFNFKAHALGVTKTAFYH